MSCHTRRHGKFHESYNIRGPCLQSSLIPWVNRAKAASHYHRHARGQQVTHKKNENTHMHDSHSILLSKDTAPCPMPGLKSGKIDPEIRALTMGTSSPQRKKKNVFMLFLFMT